MQQIIDYLQGKGNIVFFDWNNSDINDFLLLVVDNFNGDVEYLKQIIETNYQIKFFDLKDSVIKSEILV